NRLKELAEEVPQLEMELTTEQEKLAELEESQTSSEWQTMQQQIKEQETLVTQKEQDLRQLEARLLELETQGLRLQERMEESQKRLTASRRKLEEYRTQTNSLVQQQQQLNQQIEATETRLQELTEQLKDAKIGRDRAEEKLRQSQDKQQKLTWQQQKLQDTQQERQDHLSNLEDNIQQQEADLPSPLPEVPHLVSLEERGEQLTFETYAAQLEQLQKDLQNTQKRLESLEPVNMLALEEYEKTEERLVELTEKLTTLEAERTELLLRIENFTTLRFRAFQEAFDAVNENFETIFATLSQGDGYLELENPENPFEGGLNLIAHPKGKPVQRLSSMSGGEKSLTALSFIFALQRYRPSPFYAFDEVDMFLDGANVERLSKMIKQEAEKAQFIVVSLRRPMIEASERTIGVTQARGAYTQVLGIKLA
ncbi:MAG: AAA family ATPase, partial [Kamptonema sp. SIO4C4]|nr:AAA family ATPase [Kamptonema sp. SIO4C4]